MVVWEWGRLLPNPLSTYAFYEQPTLNGQLLNGSALATAVVGGQGESLYAAASTDTAGQDIIGVQVITTLTTKVLIQSETETRYMSPEHHHLISFLVYLVIQYFILMQ